MSATPQDFSIWSRLTGNPYPRTPEERMALAPHVRTFVENVGRQGGYVPQPQQQQQRGGFGQAVRAIGKTALAAGILTGGALAAHHYLNNKPPGGGGDSDRDDNNNSIADSLESIHTSAANVLNEQAERGSNIRRTGTVMTKLPLLQSTQEPEAAESNIQIGTPFESPVQRAQEQDELIGYTPAAHVEAFRKSPQYYQMQVENNSLRNIQNPTEPASVPQVVRNSRDVTPPTTAQRLGQGNINPEIQVRQIAKGAAPGTEARESLETKPVTESKKLVTSQSFAPSAPTGPSNEEIRDLDETLLLAHGANTNRIQRESMRNEMLAKKYSGQAESGPEYVGTGVTVTSSTQSPAPKEFLHAAVEDVKQRAHLNKYGYDPKQKQAPSMEQVGPAHADLLSEQLQRERSRAAGRGDIYKQLQGERNVNYVPQPREMMAVHGKGFFHPSAFGQL